MTRAFQILVVLALLATACSTLRVFPHQLAYFNEAAGGPENGYRQLLHSNLDWGQDLLFLACWVDRHELDRHSVAVNDVAQAELARSLGFSTTGRFSDGRTDVPVIMTAADFQNCSGDQGGIAESKLMRVSPVYWLRFADSATATGDSCGN